MAHAPGSVAAMTPAHRRQRIHELVLALLAQQGELELLDAGSPDGDPGSWLARNRRLVQRYQALVRSAATLDALIDQEVGGDPLGDPLGQRARGGAGPGGEPGQGAPAHG